MKKKKLWWIGGGLGAVLLALVILGRSRSDDGVKVAVEAAAPHTITETVTASGKIYPETEVKISPEVSGEIIALQVQEGDRVQAGQLLARINPAVYSSAVAQAEASVQQSRASAQNTRELIDQAQAQFEQARAAYTRNQQLYREKVISVQEFEQAEATYKSARATYEAARASASGGRYGVQGATAGLAQAQANLQKATLLAPVAGVVSALNVKLGERVVGTAQMAGTEILTIADMSRMEVRVDVSETDIEKVKVGDTALVETDAYRNRKFTGVVSRVSVSSKSASGGTAASTDQVTNYTVRILILPESYADLTGKLSVGKFVFKPGMSASVDIITRKERGVLSVPVNAVTTRDWPDSVKKARKDGLALGEDDDIRQVVFVVDKASRQVRLRDVTTGIQDNNYLQVTGGIRSGEEVVIAPYSAVARLLKDKSSIRVVKKESLFETPTEE